MSKSKPHVRYNKVIVSMTIDPDQCQQLDAIVTLRRTSRAAIIREAIDLYLRENSRVAPSLPQVGMRPERVA